MFVCLFVFLVQARATTCSSLQNAQKIHDTKENKSLVRKAMTYVRMCGVFWSKNSLLGVENNSENIEPRDVIFQLSYCLGN